MMLSTCKMQWICVCDTMEQPLAIDCISLVKSGCFRHIFINTGPTKDNAQHNTTKKWSQQFILTTIDIDDIDCYILYILYFI